jgi:hypothetical protein
MIINWDGRDWELSFEDITIKQAEAIEKETGQPLGAWLDSLNEDISTASPQFLPVLKIVYWLMLAQSGDQTPIAAVDFPLLRFGQAFAQAAAAEAAPAEQPAEPPDPTQGATSPATSSTPPTPTGGSNGKPAAVSPAPA